MEERIQEEAEEEVCQQRLPREALQQPYPPQQHEQPLPSDVDSRVMLAGRHPSRGSSLSVAVRQTSLGGELDRLVEVLLTSKQSWRLAINPSR